jgi:hypothetical protein
MMNCPTGHSAAPTLFTAHTKNQSKLQIRIHKALPYTNQHIAKSNSQSQSGFEREEIEGRMEM